MRSHRLRAAAGNAAGGIITSNLELYWDFGNTSCYNSSVSNTAITDLSGNGYNATFQNTSSYGAITFNSNNGGFVELSNEQKYVKLNTATFLALTFGTSPFTFEYFMNIKSSGFSLFTESAFEYNGSNFLNPEFSINVGPASTGIKLIGKGLEGYQSTSHISANSIDIDTTNVYANLNYGWEHFVASRTSTSNGGMNFYRNNSLIKSTRNSSNYTIPSPGYFILFGGNTFFQQASHFAILRIYKGKGLTASEVAQHYNFEKARFGLT